MEYHDYTLSIDSAGQVRSTARDGGEEKESFALDDNGLMLLKRLLDCLRTEKLKGRRDFEELGGVLYDALIRGQVRAHLGQAFDTAQRQGNGLRVRLDLDNRHRLADGTRTAALPWEFLHGPKFDFLATHPALTLSRYVPLGQPTKRPRVQAPLRVMFVAAQPKGLPPVFTEAAAEALEREFDAAPIRDYFSLERLDRADWDGLVKAVKRDRPHVLHFMGHARFRKDVDNPTGELALVGPDGPNWVPQAEFRNLFQAWQPHMAVLVACEGAQSSTAWNLPSLACEFACYNVQVVAMQFEISNEVALAFTRELYGKLAAGMAIDVAAQSAREGLLTGCVPTMRDFGVPVLWMRSPDRLIQPPKKLKLEIVTYPGYAPFYLAMDDMKMSRWEFLDTTTESRKESRAKLRQKSASAFTATLDMTINDISREALDQIKPHCILVLCSSAGADAVIGAPEITSIEQLRRKRIGTWAGSSSHTLLLYELLKHGITDAVIEHVDDPRLLVERFKRREQMDAVATWSPWQEQAAEHGHVLAPLGGWKEELDIYDALFVHKPPAAEHLTAYDELFDAWEYGVSKLRSADEGTYRQLSAHLNLSPEQTRQAIGKVTFYTIQDNVSGSPAADWWALILKVQRQRSQAGLVQGGQRPNVEVIRDLLMDYVRRKG
jgi:hypothetical protein